MDLVQKDLLDSVTSIGPASIGSTGLTFFLWIVGEHRVGW